MTPLALHMLIWFHTRPVSTPFEGIENDPQQEIVRQFLADGIIDRADFPALTDRGRAWLDMILETPMPVQQWIDPRGAMDIRDLPGLAHVKHLDRSPEKWMRLMPVDDAPSGMTSEEIERVRLLDLLPSGYTPHDGTGRPPIWDENGKVGMPDVVLVYRGLPKPKQQRPNRLPLGSVNWKWGAAPSNDDVIGYRIAEME